MFDGNMDAIHLPPDRFDTFGSQGNGDAARVGRCDREELPNMATSHGGGCIPSSSEQGRDSAGYLVCLT